MDATIDPAGWGAARLLETVVGLEDAPDTDAAVADMVRQIDALIDAGLAPDAMEILDAWRACYAIAKTSIEGRIRARSGWKPPAA